MKKILLSAGVILCFVLYSVFMRDSDASTIVARAKPQTADITPPTTNPSPAANQTSPPPTSSSTYKDGTFVGSTADAFYGNIQVEAVIQSGKITDVRFLQSPNDRPESIQINQQAMPMLKEEALQAQSAHIDGVTGATDTSQAFVESLASALTKAMAA